MRCSTGHATVFATTPKQRNPAQDTTIAGMNAVRSLA
jgi:hypothetical protein